MQRDPEPLALVEEDWAFVRKKVAAGRYASDAEVVRAGLRILRETQHLRALIAEGEADAEAGRVSPADEVMHRLRQRIAKADRRDSA